MGLDLSHGFYRSARLLFLTKLFISNYITTYIDWLPLFFYFDQNEYCFISYRGTLVKIWSAQFETHILALVTLSLVYIDENLSLKTVPRGLAVFQSAQLLGPAIGFIAGGALLNQWVDGGEKIQKFTTEGGALQGQRSTFHLNSNKIYKIVWPIWRIRILALLNQMFADLSPRLAPAWEWSVGRKLVGFVSIRSCFWRVGWTRDLLGY